MSDLHRLRGIRNQAKSRLAELDVPWPFDVQVLCDRLAVRRGRSIHLRAVDLPTGTYGLWADVEGVDHILYERATTQLHQEQIILHEVGHLLARHRPVPVADYESMSLLMPDLDPDMIRRVLQRHGYTDVEEQEAELLASLVLERIARERVLARSAGPEDSDVLERLADVLGGTVSA